MKERTRAAAKTTTRSWWKPSQTFRVTLTSHDPASPFAPGSDVGKLLVDVPGPALPAETWHDAMYEPADCPDVDLSDERPTMFLAAVTQVLPAVDHDAALAEVRELHAMQKRVVAAFSPRRQVEETTALANEIARSNAQWFAEAERRERRISDNLLTFHQRWAGLDATRDAAEIARRFAAADAISRPVSIDTVVAGMVGSPAEDYRRELDAMLAADGRVAA